MAQSARCGAESRHHEVDQIVTRTPVARVSSLPIIALMLADSNQNLPVQDFQCWHLQSCRSLGVGPRFPRLVQFFGPRLCCFLGECSKTPCCIQTNSFMPLGPQMKDQLRIQKIHKPASSTCLLVYRHDEQLEDVHTLRYTNSCSPLNH